MHTTDSLLPLHAWPEKVQPRDPVSPRAGALSFLLFAVLIAFAFAMSGCHTLTDAQRKTIATNAAAGRADVRGWDAMTPAQQRAAIVGSTAAWIALDYPVNGTDPGPEWRDALGAPAPATKDAETAHCSNVPPGCLKAGHLLHLTQSDPHHRYLHDDGSVCHAFCPSTCPQADK